MFSSSGLLGDAEAAVLTMRRMQSVVDNCPEKMHAADAEAPRPPRPPRIETAVEFWSRFFCCTRKKKRNKKKQELAAAGEC